MNGQSENKVYRLNGQEYRLKKIDLGVLNKAAPLLLRFRRLQYEYTKDIDDSELRKAKSGIEEIKTALFQLEPRAAGDINEISRLKTMLSNAETELKNSRTLQSVQGLINDAESLALFELLTERDTILPFLRNILETEHCNQEDIPFDKPESLEFIKDVVTDFFALTLRNKER